MTEHAELELAHRYAALTLEPAEIEAFEDHLVDCAECQAEVQLAIGMRQLLREDSVAPTIPKRWIVAGTGLLAAAAVTGVIVLELLGNPVASLGDVKTPPAYIGVPVRAAQARGDSLFAAAMDAYNAGQYADASRGLNAALLAGVDSIPAQFFMASAQLMAGKNRDAVANYGRVIAGGTHANAYLGEAYLFRARGLLRLGRADEALSDLRSIDSTDAVPFGAAKALADSIHQVIRR